MDDAKLLIGVYEHGLGNWESVRDDPSLGLSKKVYVHICVRVSVCVCMLCVCRGGWVDVCVCGCACVYVLSQLLLIRHPCSRFFLQRSL